MKQKRSNTVAAMITGVLILAGPAAMAQSQPTVEVSGIFGGAFGFSDLSSPILEGVRQGLALSGAGNASLSMNKGSSFKWVTGGEVAVPVNEHVYITGDFLYNRLGNPSINVSVPGAGSVGVGFKLSLIDITGGAQYVFGASGSRFRPYAAAGGGIVRLTSSGSSSNLPSDISASETDLTTNFGGGVRLFLGEHWGIRPDVRFVHFPGENYTRATVGVFFQFGGR